MFVRHTKMTAWGTGIVLEERGGQRSVLFADGVRRAFKVALADQLLVATEPASEEERLSLTRARASGGAPSSVNLALETQLAAGFDDPAPFLVYADWLLQKGDPRGDLIHAQARRAAGDRKGATAETKLLKEHAQAFLPEAFRRKGDYTLTWQLGFLAAVQLGALDSPDHDGEARVAALLAHPSAQYLSELAFTDDSYQPSPIATVARAAHPHLAKLTLGGPIELSAFAAGDLGPLFTLPALRELVVTADALAVVAPIAHAKLARLAITMRRDDARTFDHLTAIAAPALTALALDCLYGFDGPPVNAFANVPALTSLTVRNTTETRAWLQRIAMLPFAQHLVHLGLPDGDLDDAAIPALLALRAKFPALASLDLAKNHLSDEAERLVAGFAANVRAHGKPVGERRAGPVRALVDASPAARELANVARWSVIGYDTGRNAAWGEYPGSRGTYAVYAERGGGEGCSCPSFQRPCKHALALRIMLAENIALPDRAPVGEGFYNRALSRPRFESTGE